MRFEYRRSPDILATGVATISKEAVGDWDMASFYTLRWDRKNDTYVSAFMLNSLGPTERQAMLETLDKSAQFLVFKSGELARVDKDDKMSLQVLLHSSQPMFDENAILHMVR